MRSPRFPTGCSSITLAAVYARGLRSGQVVALLYLDMDRIQRGQRTFGHAPAIAPGSAGETPDPHLPKDTVIGRLAGDEFALFVADCPRMPTTADPSRTWHARYSPKSAAVQLNQQEVYLTASIGVAFCPRDAENRHRCSSANADAAMYYSKQNGGNTFAFYSPEMNAAAVERLMLKSKLRRRGGAPDELVIAISRKSTCATPDHWRRSAVALAAARPRGRPTSMFIPLPRNPT